MLPALIKALTRLIPKALGTLQVLSELTKSGGSLESGHLPVFRDLISVINSNERLTQNTLVQKWKVKLTSRLAMSELPGRVNSAPKKREWKL